MVTSRDISKIHNYTLIHQHQDNIQSIYTVGYLVHKSTCYVKHTTMYCFKLKTSRLNKLVLCDIAGKSRKGRIQCSQENSQNTKRISAGWWSGTTGAFTCIMNARPAINSNNFVCYSSFLQQDYNQGRDTSRKLLMALLRFLWKYFVFNSQRRPALTPNFARWLTIFCYNLKTHSLEWGVLTKNERPPVFYHYNIVKQFAIEKYSFH